MKNKKISKIFRPRLSIFKSKLYIYAQIIDDKNSHTIISCSSLDKEIYSRFDSRKKNNCIISNLIGIKLGILLHKKKIFFLFLEKKYKFTGRVKALIEGISSQGIYI